MSVALTVKNVSVSDSACVGLAVPSIIPLLVLSSSPVGKLPVSSENVTGVLSAVTSNVSDTSVPVSIVEICKDLAKCGKRVVVAGLEKDYMGKGFGSMPEIMVDAEYITKVNAICINCGDPANYSHRIGSEKKQIVVGETDKYEALCRRCYEDYK